MATGNCFHVFLSFHQLVFQYESTIFHQTKCYNTETICLYLIKTTLVCWDVALCEGISKVEQSKRQGVQGLVTHWEHTVCMAGGFISLKTPSSTGRILMEFGKIAAIHLSVFYVDLNWVWKQIYESSYVIKKEWYNCNKYTHVVCKDFTTDVRHQ